jgi:hypothetical protein
MDGFPEGRLRSAVTDPVSYYAIGEFLATLPRMGQVVSLYRELVDGGGRLPIAEMLAAILEAIDTADLFPVHAVDVYDIREGIAWGDLPPLQYYVHFEGLDLEDAWEFYSEPVHLVMALMEGCGRGDLYEQVYSGEARAWWEEHAPDYDLPDLDSLDGARVAANLQAAEAMPWSGLWAIWNWIACNNENWFVDVPCSVSAELDLGLDWNIADVHMLQREYADACRRFFEPIGELTDLWRRAPNPTLGQCFELALAGCPAAERLRSERPSDNIDEEETEEAVYE